jgi:hypothetical protein
MADSTGSWLDRAVEFILAKGPPAPRLPVAQLQKGPETDPWASYPVWDDSPDDPWSRAATGPTAVPPRMLVNGEWRPSPAADAWLKRALEGPLSFDAKRRRGLASAAFSAAGRARARAAAAEEPARERSASLGRRTPAPADAASVPAPHPPAAAVIPGRPTPSTLQLRPVDAAAAAALARLCPAAPPVGPPAAALTAAPLAARPARPAIALGGSPVVPRNLLPALPAPAAAAPLPQPAAGVVQAPLHSSLAVAPPARLSPAAALAGARAFSFPALLPPPAAAAPCTAVVAASPPRQPLCEVVTNCIPMAPAMPMRAHGAVRRELARRPERLPDDPPFACAVPSAPVAHRRRAKGSLHAASCAGPWACALDLMPPPPLVSGRARAHAGLSDVAITRPEIDRVENERAARALVGILPFEVAPWLLKASVEDILGSHAPFIAEELVDIISGFAASSTGPAYSALGRLLSWVRANRPGAPVVTGLHVREWARAEQVSQSTWEALAWLRDHLGLDLHQRTLVARSAARQGATREHRELRALTPLMVLGLEHIAATDSRAPVATVAAGFAALAKMVTRVKQGTSMCINAVVPRSHEGSMHHVFVCSVDKDKHCDASAQRPRPAVGIASSAIHGDLPLEVLRAALDGRAGARSLLLDTDSANGDPTDPSTTTVVTSPLFGARAARALRALLQMEPIGLSPGEAGLYCGHSAKRFILQLAEASPLFDADDQRELGRFCGSTAQADFLVPSAALLERHTARCAVVPAMYAGPEKLESLTRLMARAAAVMRTAVRRALEADDVSSLRTFDVYRDICVTNP